MANPKNAAWYSGGLSMDVGPGVGNIFYVYGIDGAGAGSNTWGLNYKGVTAQLPS